MTTTIRPQLKYDGVKRIRDEYENVVLTVEHPFTSPIPPEQIVKAGNHYEELVEVLEEVLHWSKQDATNEDGYPPQDMLEARVKRIKAVLAKVKGV